MPSAACQCVQLSSMLNLKDLSCSALNSKWYLLKEEHFLEIAHGSAYDHESSQGFTEDLSLYILHTETAYVFLSVLSLACTSPSTCSQFCSVKQYTYTHLIWFIHQSYLFNQGLTQYFGYRSLLTANIHKVRQQHTHSYNIFVAQCLQGSPRSLKNTHQIWLPWVKW